MERNGNRDGDDDDGDGDGYCGRHRDGGVDVDADDIRKVKEMVMEIPVLATPMTSLPLRTTGTA